jgi:zona occludens toxin
MAINAYVGLMGSGKTFEVVSSVIVPALLKGRRVVTNIDGIDDVAISEYLITVKGGNPDEFGQLVSVTNDDVTKVGFFPDETKPEQPSIVQGGDLVCIDECWNFWGTDNKIADNSEHMRFFRMHRHYTEPATGVTCDLALMIQDLASLNRKIRPVIEMTTRTVKLKSVGAPKAYRIELFEGNKTTKLTKIDTFVKRYDKAIFSLYKSYAAGSGSEKSIDKRQNVLTNPRLWFIAAMAVVFLVAGGYFTYRFFQPASHKVPPVAAGPGAALIVPAPISKTEPASDFSPEWRYAGTLIANGESWAVVVDSGGRIRVESPSVFTGKGVSSYGVVDGHKVTPYSGSYRQSGATLPSPLPTVPPGATK